MATAPDISKLNFTDLQKLVDDATALIDQKKAEEVKVLVNQFKLKLDKAGITVLEAAQELAKYAPPTVTKAKRVGAPSTVKFRDPKTGDVWSGKGRTARWLQAHIDAGKKREDFLVK